MDITSFLQLNKPGDNDYITDDKLWKDNPDKIDSQFYNHDTRLGTVETGLSQKANQTDLDTVSSSLAEMGTNVKTLGAKGDGVTDDTVAIQTAINNATEEVFLPAGTYNFSSLQLKEGLILRGAGRDQITLSHTGIGKAFYNSTGVSIGQISLSDFTLKCTPNTTIGIEFSKVYLSVAERINIVQSSGGSASFIGVSFDQGASTTSYYNSFYDVAVNGTLSNPIGTGFKFNNSANSNRLIGCRTNQVTTAVNIANATTDHIVIAFCTFEEFTTGITDSGYRNVFIGNRFENNGTFPNSTGITLSNTTANDLLIGNQYINLTNAFVNNNHTGANMIMENAQMNTQMLSHDTNGGWNSLMDMRGYNINNIGNLTFAKANNGGFTTQFALTPEIESGSNDEMLSFFKGTQRVLTFDGTTNSVKNITNLISSYLSVQTGMISNLNMRNYSLQNAGLIDMTKNTSSVAGNVGRVAYADGVTWNPGSGEGLYVYKSTGWKFIG